MSCQIYYTLKGIHSFNELIIDLFPDFPQQAHYESSAKIEEPVLGYMSDMLVAIAEPVLDDMVAIVALDIVNCIAVVRNV